jgi:NADP-dependent 3-hydroxy acid dehydrogenase YdfG
MRLAGAVALVTGASRGIGRATALALARAGADVALAARSLEDLERLADDIEQLGRSALVVKTDVAERAQAEQLVDRVSREWGRVDVLVANAGLYLRRPLLQLRAEDIEQALQVNFYGSLHPILAILPQLTERRRGHIVVVGSLDGRRAIPGDGPYAIAKAALSGLVQVLRQELRPHGVGVTGVYPGRIDTTMIADLHASPISPKAPPERVATAIVRAIEHNRAEVVVPRSNRSLLYADLLSPRATEWAIAKLGLSGHWQKPQE